MSSAARWARMKGSLQVDVVHVIPDLLGNLQHFGAGKDADIVDRSFQSTDSLFDLCEWEVVPA